MPRKTKEELDLKSNKEEKKSSSKVVSKTDTKSNIESKSIPKKENTSKEKTSSSKNESTKKTTAKNKTTKSSVAKKAPSKQTAKKTTTRATKKSPSTTPKKTNKKVDILEYYDLPYRYNQTIVKILAQTPKTLFVYWDVSDGDRKNYIDTYGEDFFNKTRPVLIVHNTTMNYSFEIEINDFANSWYFNVSDERCKYVVELGRRNKEEYIKQEDTVPLAHNYLYITSSNTIDSPNGHILFEQNQKTVFYRNVKTNKTYSKNVANLNFIRYMGKIYNIYDMYHEIYKDEESLDLNNPSSNNPTSRF